MFLPRSVSFTAILFSGCLVASFLSDFLAIILLYWNTFGNFDAGGFASGWTSCPILYCLFKIMNRRDIFSHSLSLLLICLWQEIGFLSSWMPLLKHIFNKWEHVYLSFTQFLLFFECFLWLLVLLLRAKNSAASWAWSVLLNYEEACATERYEVITVEMQFLWRNILFTFNKYIWKYFYGLNHKLLNDVEKFGWLCLTWLLQL